ncbi:hypothetical protein [Anaerobranca gottschalkii]|uniref:Peptidase family M1 n=1 Tax=Anaerobranca gottschalkii DSM 13577 TaxID=1120990 RepID=A0A1I0AIB8_9FIRM|nr:hypothetical protein [Anaerobranca gottschalkii]SES94037.1 hypothetical protein SAMN03080614_102214 [Anaerobranca gottschalkii DSM 13577]
MNLYRPFISSFYSRFLGLFTQKITKLSAKIYLTEKTGLVEFETTIKFRPTNNNQTIHFLLSRDCKPFEINYLGLPLKFKTKPLRFLNNIQLLIIELPIKPSISLDLTLTFKYYCSQSQYISFNSESILIDNRGRLFPYTPEDGKYYSEVNLIIPQSLHIISGGKIIRKTLKHNGQHLTIGGDSSNLSFIMTPSLKTTETIGDITITLLYPRQYLNQARTLINLTKLIVQKYLDNYGNPNNLLINIAIIPGDFEIYFDGDNIIIPTSLLERIKEEGKNPKEREKLYFINLVHQLSKYWWNNLSLTHPDEIWLLNGVTKYSALLTIKDTYGDECFYQMIAKLQQNYVNSIGYRENISIIKSSYGLGRDWEINYPLNVLLIHTLNFLSNGKINQILQQIKQEQQLSWTKLITLINKKYDLDLKWLTDNFIKKHSKCSLELTKVEWEKSEFKGNFLEKNKGWKGPIEILLVYEDNETLYKWDGLTLIKTKEDIKKIIIDPNLYIPGNTSGVVYENNFLKEVSL